MRAIPSFGSHRMRAATSAPATRVSALTISPTVTDSDGTFRVRCIPRRSAGRSCAMMKLSTATVGEASTTRLAGSTGQTEISPFSGSRNRLLANDDAAAFGRPGRTLIVGSRMARPSMNPRLA